MGVNIAKEYYEIIDSPNSTPADLAEMYSQDATLKSPREGTFRGRDGIEEFYGLNEEFFEEGAHHMTDFYTDGDTVICEGTVEGETTDRSYEGIGLVDVMKFDADDNIAVHRVYLDYSGILSEPPENVPSFE